jgi:hypothetical protein
VPGIRLPLAELLTERAKAVCDERLAMLASTALSSEIPGTICEAETDYKIDQDCDIW